MMLRLKEAVILLGVRVSLEGAMANPLEPRADSSSAAASLTASRVIAASASSSPPSSASASPSHSASAASASSLPSKTGSITLATIASGSTPKSSKPTASAASSAAITSYRRPHFTETRSHAWHAHGVNATVNSTWIYTGTNTASTATSLPAGAVITGGAGNRTIADIPEDLIYCQINATIQNQSPLCSPKHDQQLWVGHVYAANWNPELFLDGATNYIEIHNANSTDGKDIIFTTEKVANKQGYINIEMLRDYLLKEAGNDTDSSANLTFTLISTPASGADNRTLGPTVHLTLDPSTLPKIKVQPDIQKKIGFEIGLPIGLVALVIIALSICCAVRRSKRNWSHVGNYGKDYMRKRTSRRGGRKGNAIELNDYDFDSSTARTDRFEDEPTRGGNAFRDEIERQKEEEFRNRPQKITSF